MSVDYRTYIASDQWKRVRHSALYRSIGRHRVPACEVCGRGGLGHKNRERLQVPYSNGLQVHHLHYRNLGYEQPEDLIVLCTDVCFLNEYMRYPPAERGPFPSRVGCHERTHDDRVFRAEVDRIARARYA